MHYITAKSLLTANGGMNVYRGCQHGCIYCDSRSTCYHIDHAFEDIAVKQNAPVLLEGILRRKRRKCMIGTGSMSDPYMPLENELKMTRRCLEIIESHGFGATVITKSDLILRDVDLIQRINSKAKFVVQMTLTTADDALSRQIEPNVCTSRRRYEVLKEFQRLQVPTVVWLTPILPFINDTRDNICQILEWCADASVQGIICPAFGLTLREGNREYFYASLDRIFAGKKLRERYIDSFGLSYNIPSSDNRSLMAMFTEFCRRHNIISTMEGCFEYLHEFPQQTEDRQLSLFE